MFADPYERVYLNQREASGLPPYRVWHAKDRKDLMRAVDANIPRKQLAERYNVSVNAINGMVFRIRHGLPVGPRPRKPT